MSPENQLTKTKRDIRTLLDTEKQNQTDVLLF